MELLYDVSQEAQQDLFEIWRQIARDSVSLADRIENEIHEVFEALGRMPSIGHVRRDITKQRVLLFPVYSFLVVYERDERPVRILAVVRGKRDLRRVLAERL